MFRKLLVVFFVVLTSCSNDDTNLVINDKLFNGYSYPVEGGISSTYVNSDINVIFFYNIKSSNLFSICSGEVVRIEDKEIEIDCDSGEKVVYFEVEAIIVEEENSVDAGEKIGDLEVVGSLESSRYKVNIIFYKDKDNLKKSFTDQEFIDYLS